VLLTVAVIFLPRGVVDFFGGRSSFTLAYLRRTLRESGYDPRRPGAALTARRHQELRSVAALTDLSLDVAEGEILGITGPTGPARPPS